MTLLAALLALASTDTFDVIVRNGTILDGSGKPGYVADIGIKDGRITAIGDHLKGAPKVIEAKGLDVAPGFIDVHTHAENILKLPNAENFIHDGVTSIVIGNCGGSVLDVKDFFQKLEAVKPALNIATLVGHNSIRQAAMGGSFDRAPTKPEQQKMEDIVDKAMKDGAVGLSTGLEYVPGAYSKSEEVIDLAAVAAKYGGIYTSHMRSEGIHEKKALAETFLIGAKTGIHVHVSHIKLDCKPTWGQAKDRLDQIKKAGESGVTVTQDQYPYTAYSTTIALLLPPWALEGDKQAIRARILDRDTRAKIEKDMVKIREDSGEPDYGWVAIASNKDPRLNGLRIPAAAKIVKGSSGLASQISLVFDLVTEDHTMGVFFAMSEEDVERFMKHPNTMIISDSDVQSTMNPDLPHPRGYGSNARILAEYVRKRHVLELPDAIRRMTSLPASTFKIKDRGMIVEGDFADLVVFDPNKVQDMATFPNPRVYPAGIEDVIVNGVPVIDGGHPTTARPGKPIRRGE